MNVLQTIYHYYKRKQSEATFYRMQYTYVPRINTILTNYREAAGIKLKPKTHTAYFWSKPQEHNVFIQI